MTPHVLILAAGAGTRMRGADKLLEPVAGEPMLRRIARAALATGVPVTAALPPDRPLREAALAGLSVTQVVVPNPGDGMAASLVAGLMSMPQDAPVMLLLADLPELTEADLSLMLRDWNDHPDLILRATDATGQPGHPVCFPAWARTDLLRLSGDTGARDWLARNQERLRLVTLPDRHATTDLDTPEAWEAWRSRQT
jgi:CTP:molybdopterin cytidylyltransferase MocA